MAANEGAESFPYNAWGRGHADASHLGLSNRSSISAPQSDAALDPIPDDSMP